MGRAVLETINWFVANFSECSQKPAAAAGTFTSAFQPTFLSLLFSVCRNKSLSLGSAVWAEQLLQTSPAAQTVVDLELQRW